MRSARTLGPWPRGASGWPRLLFFTDPVRTPDPARVAASLPRGAAIVYRAFGAADAVAVGRRLARLAHRRGVLMFVGADPVLAAAVGADGLHLPERLATRKGANGVLRRRFRLSAAAHGLTAARRARAAGVDAVVVSPVFPSRSPSAGRPIGALRFRALVRVAGLPVYALGGVTPRTAMALKGCGAAGLAAVEALDSNGALGLTQSRT
ncbi:MAG TPA: thiamine phosphate synthase [Caulobacteraceae bacterium]|jgi:thiamine-phosphate pyrophosphorylase